MAAALGLSLRVALALVLLRAAAGKLRAPGGLAELGHLLGATGVPAGWRRPAAIALTAAELLVATGLVVPATGLPATLAGAALFAVLTAGVLGSVRRGLVVACRCFGANGGQLSAVHVARNAILTLLAVAALAAALLPGGDGLPSLPMAVPALLAGLLLGELLVRWEDLAAVLRPGPARPPRSTTARSTTTRSTTTRTRKAGAS